MGKVENKKNAIFTPFRAHASYMRPGVPVPSTTHTAWGRASVS